MNYMKILHWDYNSPVAIDKQTLFHEIPSEKLSKCLVICYS